MLPIDEQIAKAQMDLIYLQNQKEKMATSALENAEADANTARDLYEALKDHNTKQTPIHIAEMPCKVMEGFFYEWQNDTFFAETTAYVCATDVDLYLKKQ